MAVGVPYSVAAWSIRNGNQESLTCAQQIAGQPLLTRRRRDEDNTVELPPTNARFDKQIPTDVVVAGVARRTSC